MREVTWVFVIGERWRRYDFIKEGEDWKIVAVTKMGRCGEIVV